MKRISLLLAGLMALLLVLPACGSSDSSSAVVEQSTAMNDSAGFNSYASDKAGELDPAATGEAGATAAEAPDDGSSSIYRDENAKLIREANLELQTTAFDNAVAALNALVSAQNGYFESSQVYQGSYYNEREMRSGYYTIRVPAENYSPFLTSVGNVGYVSNQNESTTDIGESYFDTESRLKTQQTKYDRLLALLEKANTMEDIISLENAISETEYMIEQYTSTLNRYDTLVSYSTITVSLNEVLRIADDPAGSDTLGARMAAGLKECVAAFGEGIQDAAVWFAYHFIGVLLFAVVVTVVSVVGVKKRKAVKKAKVSNEAPIDPADQQP